MVPIEGEIKLLEYMLNVTASDNPMLKLYSNNVTLSRTTILSDFTECSDISYVAIELLPAGCVIAADVDCSLATYAEQTFTFAGAQNVYGYYVTNHAGTKVIWAKASLCIPIQIPSTGGTVVIRPRFTGRSDA